MTVRGGRARLLDWGEAAVSHPFAGLVNTLRDFAYRRRLEPEGREMLRTAGSTTATGGCARDRVRALADRGAAL